MQGSQLINAPQKAVWEGLNDPETLKSCILGCETIELTGENKYKVVLGVKIGPVSAKFNSELELRDLMPPDSYTIVFEGKGGVAGFGKGQAQVKLIPQGTSTQLDYVVNAQVGGKIAQVGSRLIDAAAKKIAEDFFQKFNAVLSERTGVADAAAADAAAAAASASAASASLPAARPAATDSGASSRMVTIFAAIVIALIVFFFLRK